jgi:hypothetical protein
MSPPDVCVNYCYDPFVFPREIVNRPGLTHIDYRIGAYADFREAMLRQANSSPALQAWTHREPDDPAIALYEAAAIVCHILAFYNEHFGNECFLRTATWRESVAELVRLLGYRLAPGLGGRATFAFEVKRAVTVPAGFPVKIDLKQTNKPADFQISQDTVALPHLGKFNLYRQRYYAAIIGAGANQVELSAVDGDPDPGGLAAADLKKGDRLLFAPDESMWSGDATPFTVQQAPQIVTVAKVTQSVGRTIIEFDGKLAEDWTAPAMAYRIGRTFRHFGHNAPPSYTQSETTVTGKVTGTIEYPISYRRWLNQSFVETSITYQQKSLSLVPELIPLDQEVKNLSVGTPFIVATQVVFLLIQGGIITEISRRMITVIREISSLSNLVLGCGSLSAPSTLVRLNKAILKSPLQNPGPASDLRDFQLYEVTSPCLSLGPVATFDTGTFLSSNDALCFSGTFDQVKSLAGRRLILLHDNGLLKECVCTNSAFQELQPRFWSLSFDCSLSPLVREDFDEKSNQVTAFGNLVDATQGKAEPESVLGNGDSRLPFQTFKLPKAPLTYLMQPGTTPPEVPQLEVLVNGRLWKRVSSLFGRGPKEQIYIVREDADGNSYVQFGNGDTGARLPSGIKNVTCRQHSGIGAFGPARPGASPSTGQQLDGLDKIRLPGEASGGTQPESLDNAREAAPGRIQSLDRLVSLRDYETEALALAGVTAVSAAWGLVNNIPSVTLRVLLESGRETEFAQVEDKIAQAQICRGPNRFPVIVQQAKPRYVFVDLTYAGNPAIPTADLEAAIRSSLGLVGDDATARAGLFGLYRRRLGEKEYATRIEGTVQNVPGVLWCRVVALGKFSLGIDPAGTSLPPSPRPLAQQLSCSPLQLLQLYPNHLTLLTVAGLGSDLNS